MCVFGVKSKLYEACNVAVTQVEVAAPLENTAFFKIVVALFVGSLRYRISTVSIQVRFIGGTKANKRQYIVEPDQCIRYKCNTGDFPRFVGIPALRNSYYS